MLEEVYCSFDETQFNVVTQTIFASVAYLQCIDEKLPCLKCFGDKVDSWQCVGNHFCVCGVVLTDFGAWSFLVTNVLVCSALITHFHFCSMLIKKFLFSKCVDAFPSLEFVDGKCPWLHCVEEVLPCGDVCLQCIDDKFPSKMIPLEGTVVTEAVKMTSKGKESSVLSYLILFIVFKLYCVN